MTVLKENKTKISNVSKKNRACLAFASKKGTDEKVFIIWTIVGKKICVLSPGEWEREIQNETDQSTVVAVAVAMPNSSCEQKKYLIEVLLWQLFNVHSFVWRPKFLGPNRLAHLCIPNGFYREMLDATKNKSETKLSERILSISFLCSNLLARCSQFSCLHLDSTLIMAIYVSVFDLFGNVLKNIFQTKILVKQEKCDAFCIFALKYVYMCKWQPNAMAKPNRTSRSLSNYPPICWNPCISSNTHAATAINFKWKISVDNFSFL